MAANERGDLALAVVADGHGSEQTCRADTGSRLAVAAALDMSWGEIASSVPSDAALAAAGRDLVTRWRAAVGEHATAHPLSDSERAALAGAPLEYAYGTTLLVAGCTDTSGFALQLGDGHILLVDAAGRGELAFAPDSLVGTETYSLCLDDADRYWRSRSWALDSSHPTIIAVSTDGWGGAFEDATWYELVGRQLFERVQTDGPAGIAARLEGWLGRNAEEFGDDASMALLIEGSASPESPATRAEATPSDAADEVTPPPQRRRVFGALRRRPDVAGRRDDTTASSEAVSSRRS